MLHSSRTSVKHNSRVVTSQYTPVVSVVESNKSSISHRNIVNEHFLKRIPPGGLGGIKYNFRMYVKPCWWWVVGFRIRGRRPSLV